MKTLLEALEENTQDLKSEYLNQVRDWAEKSFEGHKKISSWKATDWCTFFNIQPRIANEHLDKSRQFLTFPDNFHNTRQARTWSKMSGEAQRAIKIGREEYVSRKLSNAEAHYKYSLIKLEDRLVKKGIDKNAGSKIEIVKGKVGINLELMISLGHVTVKAWTIVAAENSEHMVPHYRYLVK